MARPVMPRTSEDRRPWGLLIILALIVAAGTASLPLQFATYRQLGNTARTEQLRDGQRHLCEQINMIASQAGLTPTDCTAINDGR